MKEMFADCMQYDSSLKARIGGNPPKVIEDMIPDNYRFYAVLNHPEKETMLSILVYDIFEELTAHNKYPDTLVKIIEHEFSEIGSLNEKSISDLNMCSISNYKATPDKDFLFIKVGGKPRLIQPKSFFYEKLEEDNYSFFLQIEEEGYCDELYSDYVFNYGALYLYRNNETEEVIAGFWQYS